MAAIFKLMLTGSRRPAATSTSTSVETAKPVAIACTVYFPGASPVNVYTPSELVVAVFAVPDASVKVTVAPTIAAPNSSEITPRRLALAWAKTEVENAAARIRAAKQINSFLVFIIELFSYLQNQPRAIVGGLASRFAVVSEVEMRDQRARVMARRSLQTCRQNCR